MSKYVGYDTGYVCEPSRLVCGGSWMRLRRWRFEVTKKDYELIARVLNKHCNDSRLVIAFIDELRDNNPRFDSDKFIEACCKGK